jgi:hypothetical protein
MVLSFEIIGSLLVVTFIVFWVVATCNLVDYISFVEEYRVTQAACNSEMYFELCAPPPHKMSRSISPESTYE